MKYIKKYETDIWTDQTLRDSLKSHDYIVKNIIKFLNSYLKDDDYVDLALTEDIYSMWYTNNWAHKSNRYFGFNYINGIGEDASYTMTKEEYDKFVLFLNDPEMHISANKYNL